MSNVMEVKLSAKSENESLARVIVASFAAKLDPTLDELADIKTAVSEAVTNAIVHGYENTIGLITIHVHIKDKEVTIQIKDRGNGIEDIQKAREPLFSTKMSEDRAGLGFTIMEVFTDELNVESILGEKTIVTMKKKYHE